MAAPGPTEEGKALREEGKRWIERIKAAGKYEKDWIDDAEIASSTYAGGKAVTTDPEPGNRNFNILFSNVETIVPAVINSPPAPDIRRRFGDADPVAKDLSELLERSITVQVDDSRLQIEMEAAAQDAFLAGRGIVRLRFKADVEDGYDEVRKLAEDTVERDAEDDGAGGDDREYRRVSEDDAGSGRASEGTASGSASADAGEQSSPGYAAPQGEGVSGERICFEAVSWRDFRHGPAKRWEDVPWQSFRHVMSMEDRDAFADTALTDAQALPDDKAQIGETENDVVIFEVWNKRTKKVWFIEEDTGKVLKRVDDPLGLTKFFPIADPVQPIEVTGRLMPVNAYAIYRKLADELDVTTRRIRIITQKMRVKGWYSGSASDLKAMVDADDDEFVPIADAEMWAQHGGLQGAVAFWPIEKYAQALVQLYQNRELTKQAIYEITGISDIVRGASQAQETATAQQIKTQWGSLRIQKFQRMMERLARDLFVMMSEIIPTKFSKKTLETMTSIQLIPTDQDTTPTPPPQMPPMQPGQQPPPEMQQQMQQAQAQWQQAEQARMAKLQHIATLNALMGQKLQSYYRINVETDSTVRADLTRQKQEVAEFLQGAAAYFQAVGPLVQQGALPMDVAVEIFASNARMFNLGKSVEDALDRMLTMAKEASQQPPPPNPEQIKAQAEAKAREQEMAAKAQEGQQRLQEQQQAAQAKAAEYELRLRELKTQAEAKSQDAAQKAFTEKHKGDIELKLAAANLEIKRIDLQIKKAELAEKDVEVSEEGDVSSRTTEGFKAILDGFNGMSQALTQIAEMVAQNGAMQAANAQQQAAYTAAPVELIRDQNGKAVGARKVLN